jgi:DNA-binding CsgD family transcriptional regulator
VYIDAEPLQPHRRRSSDPARQRLRQPLALDRQPLRLRRYAAGRFAVLTRQPGKAFVLSGRETLLMDNRSLHEHVDRLRCGILICDADARVHWLNSSAERLLVNGALRLFDSRLLGDRPADTVKLMNELAQAEAAGGSDTVRYLRLGQAGWALHIAIQASARPSTMMLILTPASAELDISTDALMRLFDLTPAEACLAVALVGGSTLEEHAQQRGVSVGTLRVQLKHIHAKTGARRQSDVVRFVLSSAAAHLLCKSADPAESSSHPGGKLRGSG